ncbi:MAG TPA: hypothetical protein VJB34_06545, partial [Bdellovibrionota bacterium]|nr:hypothetical protein [Bdellovibrionota bacterium]
MKKLTVLLVAGLFVFGSTIANAESCGFAGCDMPGHSKTIKQGKPGHIPVVSTDTAVAPADKAAAPAAQPAVSSDPLSYENQEDIFEYIQIRDGEDLSLAATRIQETYKHFRDEAVERAYDLETTAGQVQREINQFLHWRDEISETRPEVVDFTVTHGGEKVTHKLKVTHKISDISALKAKVETELPQLIDAQDERVGLIREEQATRVRELKEQAAEKVVELDKQAVQNVEDDLNNRKRLAEIKTIITTKTEAGRRISDSRRNELNSEAQRILGVRRAELAAQKLEIASNLVAVKKQVAERIKTVTKGANQQVEVALQEANRLLAEEKQLSREVKVLERKRDNHTANIKRLYSGDENHPGFYSQMEKAQRSYLFMTAVGQHMEAQRGNEEVVSQKKLHEFVLPSSLGLGHEFDELVDENGRFRAKYTLKDILNKLDYSVGGERAKTSADEQGILKDFTRIPEIFSGEDLARIRESQRPLWTAVQDKFCDLD